MRNFRGLIGLGALGLSVLACTLTGQQEEPQLLPTPTNIVTGTPSVSINSPSEGETLTVGEPLLVSATATDSGGVTSVQLFADDVLVKTVSSQNVTGDTNLPVVLDYTPRSAGDVALKVIAYRGVVASDPAIVNVSIAAQASAPTALPSGGTGSSGGGSSGSPIIDPSDPTCRILTNTALNYRTGPGTDYARLGTFSAGQQVPIVGRLGDNSWWQVRVSAAQNAWVIAEFTTVYGNCGGIPVVAPPPPPTSTAPTATPTRTPTPTPLPSATPTITPTPRPADLVVTNISGENELTLSGGSATARYSVTITNTGNTSTGQFSSTITYLPSGSIIELGTVSNLNPGETILLSADLTFSASGQFTIQATADSDNTVTELSEVNNVGTYVVNVAAP